MSDRDRLADLLDRRRARAADPAALAELDAMLADPEVAAIAVTVEQTQRLFEQILRGEEVRARFADSLMTMLRSRPPAPAPAVIAMPTARRRRRVLAAVLVAAGLLVGLWTWSSADRARDLERVTARVSGSGVHIARGSSGPASGDAADAAPGDEVQAGDGAAVLAWIDGTRVVLSGGGRLALQPGGGKRLALPEGRVEATVAHQPSGAPLRIETPQAALQVVGTRFTLDVDEDRTRLAVSDGTVRFAGKDARTTSEISANRVAEARSGTAVDIVRRIEPVFHQDFESGDVPAEWMAGRLVRPPVDNGSAFCLMGGRQEFTGDENAAAFRHEVYATFSDDLHLGFDVLVDAPVIRFYVQVRDYTQGQNYWITLPPPAPGGWRHVEIALSSLVGINVVGPMRAGEQLNELFLVAGKVDRQGFYVDNIAVWRER